MNRGLTTVRYRYVLAPFIVYVPLTVSGFLWSVREGTLPMIPVPVFVALGVLAWTLLEYLLHRFLHVGLQGTRIGDAMGTLHLGHHRDPTKEAKVTMPVYGSLPIAVVLLGLLRLIGGSWEASLLMMTGIVSGYLVYEAVHFRIHFGSKRGRVIAFQRAAHLFHHHQDHTRCFGVTTPLWDWVFGTRRVGWALTGSATRRRSSVVQNEARQRRD